MRPWTSSIRVVERRPAVRKPLAKMWRRRNSTQTATVGAVVDDGGERSVTLLVAGGTLDLTEADLLANWDPVNPREERS